MVWHTYTTGSSSRPTLFQPTTSAGFKTLVTTSDPLIQTSAPVTSSETVPATSEVTKQILEKMITTTATTTTTTTATTTTTERGYGERQGQSQDQGRGEEQDQDQEQEQEQEQEQDRDQGPGQVQGQVHGEWRRDAQGRWIWYPSFEPTPTTKDQTDVQTSPPPVSSTMPITVSSTSITSSQTSTIQTPSTSALNHIRTSTQNTPVTDQERDDPNNRTNRTFTTTVTPTNTLPGPITTSPLSQSTASTSPTAGNDVIFDVTMSTERQRRSTIDNEEGYWLVDEHGKKLIYVRPNATGHYADAWRQFIGAATPTPNPVRPGRSGHGGQSLWVTRRPPGTRQSASGKSRRYESDCTCCRSFTTTTTTTTATTTTTITITINYRQKLERGSILCLNVTL